MTKIASVVDVDHVVDCARRRCGDLGVTVEYSRWAQTASTNGHKIAIPALKHPITQEQLDVLYGYLIHETGHIIRPEAFKIVKSAQPPQHVMSLYNIVEDDGMERERANEWKGDKVGLTGMNLILDRKDAESWEKAFNEGMDLDKQPPEPLAAMCVARIASLDWCTDRDTVTQRLINACPAQAQQLTAELVQEDWVTRMRQARTPSETWDITIDLAKRLYPDNDEDQMEQMREDGHKQQPYSPEQRDTSKDQDTEGRTKAEQGEGEGEATSGGEQADGESEEDGGTEGGVIDWRDVTSSDHGWTEQKGVPGTAGIDWSGYTSKQGVGVMPLSEVNVIDLAKNKRKGSSWDRSQNLYMPSEGSRELANRVRRYIQAQARSVVTKEKYNGRIDKSALVRLALPPIDGGDYNKRIFYDQRKHTMKDTAIFVLVDWSGSMTGRKMVYAADAAQRLVHVMDRVLHVPVMLAAFTNGKSECDIGVIKHFNKRSVSPEQISHRFWAFKNWCSANNDSDSVHWAYQQLLKRKEQRKMLIVLSDGMPAGEWAGHGHTNLEYMTKHIEQAGKVELYGVGILNDAVKNYYTNHKVLHDLDAMNQTLFDLVKDGNNV
jgi:cobaltochelatase CobT